MALPIGRGWRLAIVVLAVFAFLLATLWFGGVEMANQFGQLRQTLTVQGERLATLLNRYELLPDTFNLATVSGQLSRSFGVVTSVLGAAFGGLTTFVPDPDHRPVPGDGPRHVRARHRLAVPT